MGAIAELLDLKLRLESQIGMLTSELETISRTITILEREHPGEVAQMIFEHPVAGAPRRASVTIPPSEQGLSERCLTLLADEWTPPATVRDRLIETRYHVTNKTKLLSSVYATLKRLQSQGRAEAERHKGILVYRKSQKARAA